GPVAATADSAAPPGSYRVCRKFLPPAAPRGRWDYHSVIPAPPCGGTHVQALAAEFGAEPSRPAGPVRRTGPAAALPLAGPQPAPRTRLRGPAGGARHPPRPLRRPRPPCRTALAGAGRAGAAGRADRRRPRPAAGRERRLPDPAGRPGPLGRAPPG